MPVIQSKTDSSSSSISLSDLKPAAIILRPYYLLILQKKVFQHKCPKGPKASGEGGGEAYSKPLGVRALAIIDCWSRGLKQLLFLMPPLLFAHFKRDGVTLNNRAKKGRSHNK